MTLFPQIDFSRLGESDVREEIVAPLLRLAGYRTGSAANIIRELSLRYPRSQLGAKKPSSDPELRGRADYVCEVDGAIRWTIEAKAADVQIGTDELEQAYSYAVHPEVHGVFFCLCNGREFVVYDTMRGPAGQPILRLDYDNLEAQASTLANILGPQALRRIAQNHVQDIRPALGPGLRSIVKVLNGAVHFFEISPPNALLRELVLTVAEGAIERDEAGQLVAYLLVRSPLRSMEQMNRRLGIDHLELVSRSTSLSTDKAQPTVFESKTAVRLAAGETFFDFRSGRDMRLPMNIDCEVTTRAAGVLDGMKVTGQFVADYDFRSPRSRVTAKGAFEVLLA